MTHTSRSMTFPDKPRVPSAAAALAGRIPPREAAVTAAPVPARVLSACLRVSRIESPSSDNTSD